MILFSEFLSSEQDYTHPIKSSMFDSNTNRVGEFDFSFDILSLNVRGIRNDTKRNKIFNWLKNQRDTLNTRCRKFMV